MSFSLEIKAFDYGRPIPRRHTCDGEDVSPELSWSDAPPGTKSFALIVDDPDAPVGVWNHWLLCDISASASRLEEGFEPGRVGVSGRNDFGRRGYGGPCPPPGHGPHRYFFHLYALDTPTLGLAEGASRKAIENALKGRILAKAEYMGTYERER